MQQSDEVNQGDGAGKIQDYAGPELPPHLRSESSVNTDTDDNQDSDLIGPQLPLPNSSNQSTAEEFEMRSLKMKRKLTEKVPERAVRESWMTEIPERLGSDLGVPVAKTKFGDGKKKVDSSGWAATPQDKQTIQTPEDSDLSKNFCEERDRATASVVETYSKKARPNSLLEMHQKKLKKEMKKKKKKEKKEKKKNKKDKKDKTSERQPFDRDRDLQVNVFDDAKKRALIKHSQQLTSRFSNSTVQGQFL